MKYNFEVIKEENGYSAHCLEIEGLRTQGDTWQELEQNITEVFELWFSDVTDYEEIPKPSPDVHSENVRSFSVPLDVAFRLELYWYRKEKGLSQREIAKYLGYKDNSLRAYQKIERGVSIPSLTVLDQITKQVPELRQRIGVHLLG